MSSWRKLLYAILIFGFFLLMVEGGLRIWLPTLPSVVGLVGSHLAQAPGFGVLPRDRCLTDDPMEGGERSEHLLVLGDSVAAAFRLRPAQGFAAQLGTFFPTMKLEVQAKEGADLCAEMEMLQKRLQLLRWPKVIVWEVLADDLVSYMVYNVNHQKVAVPDAEPSGALRWWAQNSYFANFFWFQYQIHGKHPNNRLVDHEQLRRLRANLLLLRTVLERQRVIVIPVLLEAVGIDQCPAKALDISPCTWMPEDLLSLGDLFRSAGYQPLDLRGFWKNPPTQPIDEEKRVEPPVTVAIHPDADGHRRLAATIAAELQTRLTLHP